MNRRRRALRELARDLRDHIEEEIRDNIGRGMSPEEARRAAFLKFGNPALAKEDTRAVWVPVWLDGLSQDLRQSLRALGRSRKQVLVAGAVLSVSLALTGAAVAMVWSLIVSPVDVNRPDRLVVVRGVISSDNGDFTVETFDTDAQEKIASAGVFASSAIASIKEATVDLGNGPRRVAVTFVTGDYLRVLGVPVARGRDFQSFDVEDGAEIVAILTDGFWKTALGRADDVVGREIRVNEARATIVGVTTPGFRGTSFEAMPTLFLPWTAVPQLNEREAVSFPFYGWSGTLIARLLPIDSAASAEARLRGLDWSVGEDSDLFLEPFLVPLREVVAPQTSRLELFGVGRILVVVSLAFLLLGATTLSMALLLQTERRSGEIAIRHALGATSRRIASMLAGEVGVVVLLATLLALPLGAIGLRMAALVSLPGDVTVRNLDLALGVPAVRAIVLAGACVAVSVLAMTWAGTVRFVRGYLPHGSIVATGTAGGRLRRGFVVLLLSVTVALLGSATFFAQSFSRAMSVDLGYPADRVLRVDFDLVEHGYSDADVLDFVERLRGAVEGSPGVASAAVAVAAGGFSEGGVLFVDGEERTFPEFVRFRAVDASFFDAAGIRLIRGRVLTPDDRPGALPAAVVSESLAESLSTDGDALGRVFYDVYGQANVTIVGVVEDRDYNVRSPARMAIYFAGPQRSSLGGRASLLLDTDDATQARALVLDRVREIDPAVAPTSVQTIEEELLSVYALQHLASRMTGVFGIVALALVTISLHSLVMSIATARRKEIAIRTALGATRRNVFAWFGSEIGRPVVFGALLGTLGVWFAYRLMSAYIVGLRADDLGAVVVVLLAACGIAVGAALGPALWATRDAPYAVLRQD